MNINWQSEEDKQLFADAGLTTFADFCDIEEKDNLKIHCMREHRNKKTKKVDRKMVQIILQDHIFYVKRATENAFQNIKNEFEAINILPEFGLTPSKIAGWSFDESKKQGFIILKDLKGFFPIKEILKKNTPPETLDDLLARKDEIFLRLTKIIDNVYKKGYTYPDWFAKHIYIKKGSDEIALIDLERFLPLEKCPWYFSFPVSSFFVRKKILKKLRISLERESDLLSHNYLKRILQA